MKPEPTPAPASPGPAQAPAPATTPSEGQEAELVLPDGSTIIVVLPTPIPQSERVSPDIIMARLEAAMYAAGYLKPEDWVRRDYPDEADELLAEFGPTAGMGWGIATIDNRNLEKVDEYVGVNPNNGWCDIKVYSGTQ